MQNAEKKNSILLVDDDPSIREALENFLTSLGYSITTAEDASTAIDILRENPSPWAALITDFNMPHITGVELIKSASKDGLHFDHIVLISAMSDPEALKAQLENKENVRVLRKPFAIQALLDALEHTVA